MPPTNKQTPALKHLHFTNLLFITVTPFLTTFFLTTLPITQSIQVVNPTVNCEGDAVVFNFDYDIDITLANLYIGSCNAETSDRITTSKEGANSHIIEIHQNSGCEDSQNVDANNVTSYNKYYSAFKVYSFWAPNLTIFGHFQNRLFQIVSSAPDVRLDLRLILLGNFENFMFFAEHYSENI